MSRSPLTWAYVGSAIPATAAWADVADALYTLGTKVTYWDGSTRTPGSGKAGTWQRFQDTGVTQAVYCAPATNPDDVWWMFAGAAGAKTPTMGGVPDTWATNTGLIGFIRGGTTFAAWDAAQPRTGCQFSGYLRAVTCSTVSPVLVHLFESEVGIVVVWAGSGATSITVCGDIIDPGCTNADSPTGAEASGGRYVVWKYPALLPTAAWSIDSISASGFFSGQGTANNSNTWIVTVGAATLIAAARDAKLSTALGSTSYLNPDGLFVPAPIALHNTAKSRCFGLLRGIHAGPQSKNAYALSNAGTVRAWIAGRAVSADDDCIYLLAS